MIAAIYTRKSNEEGAGSNAEVKSVAVQRGVCEKFIASRGWTVGPVFTDDAVTGVEFANRPQLQALLAALDSKTFGALVVSDQDRLGRDYPLLEIVSRLDDADIEAWDVTGRRISLADDSSEMQTVLSTMLGKMERKKGIKRLRAKQAVLMAGGFSTGGNVFGYRNVRLEGTGKQPVRRVRDEVQAAIIVRIFELAAQGQGHKRIAKALNAEGVPGPRGVWMSTGVREILHRDLYRGVIVSGKVRKERKRGKKVRIKVDASQWVRVEQPELRIVTDEQWSAAHTVLAANKAAFLRTRGGKLLGRPEGTQGLFLLSNLLACGAVAPGASDPCGARLNATKRGRKDERVYICSAHALKGDTVCANASGVPMDLIHAGVVAALRETFSEEEFEKHLRKTAADDSAIQARRAERANLLTEIPRFAAKAQKLAQAIAVVDDSAALLAELKATETAQKQALARVNELEGIELDCRDQDAAIARLRETWGSWHAALEADVAFARQVLRKVLWPQSAPAIYVLPRVSEGRQSWDFYGVATAEGLLHGTVGREPGPVASGPVDTSVGPTSGRDRHVHTASPYTMKFSGTVGK